MSYTGQLTAHEDSLPSSHRTFAQGNHPVKHQTDEPKQQICSIYIAQGQVVQSLISTNPGLNS